MWCDDVLGTVTSSNLLFFTSPAAAGSLLAQPAEPVVEVVGSEAVTEQVGSIQRALLLAHHSNPLTLGEHLDNAQHVTLFAGSKALLPRGRAGPEDSQGQARYVAE